MAGWRWSGTAVAGAALLGLAGPEPAPQPARQTTITLDFRDRPVPEVVEAIASRTGRRVTATDPVTKNVAGVFQLGGPVDRGWRGRTVTLESPGPVPFWEAIDRLAEAGKLAYRVAEHGDTGSAKTGVSFEGPGEAPGPACYGGPFRVGLLGVHEHRDALLVRGPWARIYPSGVSMPADASLLASAPPDGGPLYVELGVAAEPDLVCRRDGSPKILEAIDENGRDLRAPTREDRRQSLQVFGWAGGGLTPVVRVPLGRPEGGGRAKMIKRLRGTIPVEVGILQAKPALAIPVGGSEGKTFRAGGAEFTVDADKAQANGRIRLALSCRYPGEEDPILREARMAVLRTYQIRVVDARGGRVQFGSTSGGGDGRGTLTFSYEYTPGQPDSLPPAEFQFHDLDRAGYEIPFEFLDIPLP